MENNLTVDIFDFEKSW